MGLIDHQIALGRALRVTGAVDPTEGLALDRGERRRLHCLLGSAGFDFTRRVQRSWCRGRAAEVARLTLSALPAARREALLTSWTEAGGGASFNTGLEAEAFLAFLARDFPDPSHELSICRMELAAWRASAAAPFHAPDLALLDHPRAMLRRGRRAALVVFHADPQTLVAALEAGAAWPPLGGERFPVLFAPGLSNLSRAAGPEVEALWLRCAEPIAVRALSRAGFARRILEDLFAIGALALADERGPATSGETEALFEGW